MRHLVAFVAGALAVLLFHQGAAWILYAAGLVTRAPYSLVPVAPFGVPQALSSAFWGGLWGVALAPLLVRARGTARYWLLGFVLGAIGPTLVAWFVVAPLRGQPVAGGWQAAAMLRGLWVNGAWGFGLAVLLWLAEHVNARPPATLNRA